MIPFKKESLFGSKVIPFKGIIFQKWFLLKRNNFWKVIPFENELFFGQKLIYFEKESLLGQKAILLKGNNFWP